MGRKTKGTDPVYVAEDATTGLYVNLDGEKPEPVEFEEATKYPGTPDGRISAVQRLAALAAPYELVRVDAP